VNLRKGRIGSPGYEKLRAIAKVMGFPQGNALAGRVEHLFEVIRNPKTG